MCVRSKPFGLVRTRQAEDTDDGVDLSGNGHGLLAEPGVRFVVVADRVPGAEPHPIRTERPFQLVDRAIDACRVDL